MPKVWFVAIVGRPNTGKSTLINALIWAKVSAVSHRPQTTIRSIPAIFTDEEKEFQIIFLDTPGIHQDETVQFWSKKDTTINNRINSEAFASLREADIIIRLVDPTRSPWKEDARIDEVLSFISKPIIRVETKQDMENKSYPWKNIDIRVNSIDGTWFSLLLEKIASFLPEGPYLYESDYYTNQSMDFRIQEILREVLFSELGEEIPYACYIEIGTIENTETLLKIHAYIVTEAESQKVIVIGKWWKKVSDIGMKARIILEEIFWKKVFLALRVKVHKNWRKDERILNQLFPIK